AEQMARIRRWQEAVRQRWENLTAREREVLALVAEGMSNRHIATILGLSEHTVETHVGHLLSKLDISSRAEAIAWAWQHGLVEDARP
ncbi:MAG: LuxR family transcriptional regulator, partial [Chloroflexi bacterium]